MKNNYFTLFIIVIGVFFNSCSSSLEIQKKNTIAADYSKYRITGPKRRIFVAKFENKTAYGQRRLGEGISDILTTELAKTNNFMLLEREKLDEIIKEQRLALSGFINESSAPKIGKLLGANGIITGSVTQFGVRTETSDIIITSSKKQIATCSIDIRLIDVNTGQIKWAGSGTGEASRTYTNFMGSGKAGGYDETLEGEAFRTSVIKVMEDLVNALAEINWFCTIAKVSNDKIYINAGKKSNLQIGQILNIYQTGEAIIDPTSGIEIGKEESKIGTAKLVSYLGEDGGVLTLLSGKSPKMNDICKIN